jgi:hypothetical protein
MKPGVPALLEPASQKINQHSREQTRRGGLIRDIWPIDQNEKVTGRAVVQCAHGHVWPEGGPEGTCQPCIQATNTVQDIHRQVAA